MADATAKKNLDNIFTSFIDNLGHAQEKLRDDDSSREMSGDFSLEELLRKMDAVLKSVSFDATKVAIAFRDPPLPKPNECEQLLEGAQGRVLALVSLYYGVPKECGQSLRKALKKICMKVVIGLQELLQRIKNDRYQSSQEQLNSTGTVWAACEGWSAAPKTNKEAVLAEIQAEAGLVRDALEEVEEAQSSDGEGMADFLEDLDAAVRGEEPDSSHSSRRNRTDKEKAVLVPLVGLTKACKNCLKKVRTAVKENGSMDTLEKVAQLDKIAEEVRRISPQLDELVSGMYIPVNMSALQGNAIHLSDIMHQLLDRTQGSHVCTESDLQWIEFLHKATNHNLEQLKNITKQEGLR